MSGTSGLEDTMVSKTLRRCPLLILLVGLLVAGCGPTTTTVASEEGLRKRAEDSSKAVVEKKWLQVYQFESPRFREICKSVDYAVTIQVGLAAGGVLFGFTPESKWELKITHVTVDGEEGRVFADMLIDGIPFETGGESSGDRWVFVDSQWWHEDTDWEKGCDTRTLFK